jgi:DNA-binding SARP family transcriptional activator/predicted ATPase
MEMTPLRPHSEGGVRVLPEASAEPMAPELRIRTLGTPQVWLGEVPLTFRRRKSLALLVYLALTGRAHGREVLASLFVDRASDAQAREQFRTTLTSLVEQVGPFVLVTRDTIALDRAQPSWLDADELQAATLGPSEGAAAADPQRLERAVALYEGPFLSGFALHDAPLFEDWMQKQRARLERLHVQALQLLLERAHEGGEEEAALRWTTRLLAAEPWQEEAHRQMMRLLARRGQRQAALEQYAVCRRVLREELSSMPQAETQALYEQLRAGPVAPPHNLPSLPGTFLGREREVTTLRTRLGEAMCRLVTLLGLGGSGKTRLAVQVATHHAQPVALLDEHAFADGVYLVDLAGVGSRVAPGEDAATVLGRRLAVALGRILEVDFANAADPLPALARWLGGKRLLLVLDNVEHLLAGAGVLGQLLELAPGLKVLVTSRERLRLAEEWVLEVNGLARPGSPSEVEWAPAGQLFMHHAQQVGMSGPPTVAERAAIVRICELTQGLPLALILAAHWRRALSCAAIAEELGRGLDLLTTPERGLPERQRSMRAVLARTWARLAPEEQAALRQLAVCRGGFTLEAARAVVGAERVTLLALREAQFLDSLPAHRALVHAWRDYRRWPRGAGEHDADARVAPRAFANRQPTLLRIVRREESS